VVTYQERLAAEEVEEAPASPFVQEYYPLFALLSMARRIHRDVKFRKSLVGSARGTRRGKDQGKQLQGLVEKDEVRQRAHSV
jgi:hypothetical protein